VKGFTEAAEQGCANAQWNLGDMYYLGQGVPQDYKQAYIWSSLAAVHGNKDAIKARNIIESELTPASLEKAQQEAAALMQKIEKNKAK
jgi:hypothetical protein